MEPSQAPDIFRTSLFNPQEFTITFELVPGRGSGGKRLEGILSFAEEAKKDGRIKALSITDNPGGHPALAPTSLGIEIQSMGLEPLIHFSLKDKNRNMAESQLFECHRHGLLNLLVLGGDYPRHGFHGQAMPVFDLDSPQLLRLIDRLRQTPPLGGNVPGCVMPLPSMDFLAGCVVSPFKTMQSEQIFQYAKLLTKVCSGAHFVISQLGFDMAKYQELLFFCRQHTITLPLLASVFIPSMKVAEIMCQGQVPGILFPESLMRLMQEEATSPDKGEEARLLRGARMVAALKHMGYAGVHLGGNNLTFSKIAFLLDQAESIAATANMEEIRHQVNFPTPSTWYMFPESGQQRDTPHKPSALFRINQQIHDSAFLPTGLIFPLAKKISLKVDHNKQARRLYTFCEHLIKTLFFHCRMCGDCTLAESSYLCPQSGCPKRMINGPCGGSLHGFCEVYPQERLCFWVRVYHNNPAGHLGSLSHCPPLPPKDWSLQGSSSWINYFAGRDHNKLLSDPQ
ncbi:MAG: methylenetetrahydrofolate reductase C-terminal domain-containing protein [Proteobacteria bacterium]|nr:methylenetetrahydrofolate reductase C-terminal domain-containing protein [Pseudomonadota bacterium]MBU1648295.1 methylenetetrahydrofolate reductase C-terminal domain-containing protein [Pseudomonadota bacterium]